MRFEGHAAIGLGVGLIIGSSASPAANPTVTLVQASPVVVTGAGYTAGARFFVSYRSGATVVRRPVTATIAGRYRVVLKGVTFKRCNGVQLTAPGASLRAPSCAAGGSPSVIAQPGGVVSGSAFVPTEKIALSARMGDLVVRASTTAGRNGGFTARLPWPRQACTDIDVRAVGALGSTASYTVAMPSCRKP
jgi:hypothetical protein